MVFTILMFYVARYLKHIDCVKIGGNTVTLFRQSDHLKCRSKSKLDRCLELPIGLIFFSKVLFNYLTRDAYHTHWIPHYG